MSTVQNAEFCLQVKAQEIAKIFKPGAKVTILVRNPDCQKDGSADMLCTNDSWEGIRLGIDQREAQERGQAEKPPEWKPINPDPKNYSRCRCGASAEDPYCFCDC